MSSDEEFSNNLIRENEDEENEELAQDVDEDIESEGEVENEDETGDIEDEGDDEDEDDDDDDGEDDENPLSPRNIQNWADFEFEESEDELPEPSERPPLSLPESVVSCCLKPKHPDEVSNIVGLMVEIPKLNKVECQANILRECVNCMSLFEEQFSDNDKLNLLNYYFKSRHDTLALHATRLLKQDIKKTDVSFKDAFKIESKRTPDFIYQGKNGHIVLEVAAVSDPERAYRSKGDISKGYTPKYHKELEILRAQGFNVHYSVLVFNVSNPDDRDYEEELRLLANILDIEFEGCRESLLNIEIMRKEFITQNNYIFDMYSHLLNILFGSAYEIAGGPDSEVLELYGEPKERFKGNYKRVAVSSSLYNRVTAIMPRLPKMMERISDGEPEDAKYLLTFENMNSTFKFEKRRNGQVYSDWMVSLINDSRAWVCNNLEIKNKGVEVHKPKAEFEFFSFESKHNVGKGGYSQQWFNPSHSWAFFDGEGDLADYGNRLKSVMVVEKECKYEDATLEKRLLESIVNLDRDCGDHDKYIKAVGSLEAKPLCSKLVSKEMFIKAKTDFDMKQQKPLDNGTPLITWVKPPFIYPLGQFQESDYCDHKVKPKILGTLSTMDIGPYTNRAIKSAFSPSFEFGTEGETFNADYQKARTNLASYQREITAMMKSYAREMMLKKLPKLHELDGCDEIRSKLKELVSNLEVSAKSSGKVRKNIGLIKMGRSKDLLSKDFQEEMTHFKLKKSKSQYKGVGNNFNGVFLENCFKLLKEALFSPSDAVCPDLLYDDYHAEDNNLFMELKAETLKGVRDYYGALRTSNMYHACAFISRLCHTLMFHSQTSINSSYVVPDNLGYKNVLLLVRGGKKIFSTKKSKLFRIVMPTFSILEKLYTSSEGGSNYKFFANEARTYLITPWVNMHETIIADGLTMLHRLMGFCMMNFQPEISLNENFDRVYFNLILAFHNRRQTEEMLHNLRYVFMNCMSEIAAVDEMLPELAGFNYDYFQAWVRHMISKNFQQFAETMKTIHDESKNGRISNFKSYKLLHPFNEHTIADLNSLALSIYSSYLMSKAPTTQSLEQVRNLKSIMGVHQEFTENVGEVENCYKTMEGNFLKYFDDLSTSDFNFDPSYCFLLGKFMGDYISGLERKSKLIQKWDSVLDVNWDNMANTKGLRGDPDDFFGNKGYYVVYKDVFKDKTAMDKVINLIEGGDEGQDIEKELKNLNVSYRSRIKTKKLECVIFHVVDKVQRGGGREIFVMDKETKVHQQVIEDYTKYLCKLVPNEMISIPSNRRLSTIHSKVFEDVKDHEEKYYWVLDCRKWAPKSMIEKFIIFLMGAKHALPSTFVAHAINFFTMLRKKRVYTRPHVVEILTGSTQTQKYADFFKMDESRKAYYFDMKYSWVMGIFNYFSSLMHVATQLHASHIIRVSAHMSFSKDTILHMVAHSDDSAGKLMASNKHQLIRASFIYETLMHASNHLLSRKKCNQGKLYYEFISILYIGGTLLSLLAKFTGMFNYHPTDKGYCTDITEAYSKSTELLLNGATFSQSYIAMKIQANLIYRFYFGNSISREYYNMPPAMFGIPDSHPLMILMCGSDADLFRIMQTDNEIHNKIIYVVNKKLLPLGSDQEGFLRAFKCQPNVNLGKKLNQLKAQYALPEKFQSAWTLKNVKFRHTILNGLQFVRQLNDKSFIAALQDESVTRRLSRAFYFRSSLSVETSYGPMKPREIRELIFLVKRALSGEVLDISKDIGEIITEASQELIDLDDYSIFKKTFDFIFTEVRSLNAYLNRLRFQPSSMVEFPKTNKPVYITVQKVLEENPIEYNPQSLCSWIKEPEYRHMLPDTRGYHTAVQFLEKTLGDKNVSIGDLPIEHLFLVLQKMKAKSRVEYFCYSNVPSSMREISTYQDILSFLAHNSFQGKFIQGLAVQFGKTINVPMQNITTDLDDEDLQYTISLMVLCNAIMASKDYNPNMLLLDFDAPNFLGGGVMKFKELVTNSITYWLGRHKIAPYIKCIATSCLQLLNGDSFISGSMLEHTMYHCYIKRQVLVDNVWLGQGKLFISTGAIKMVMVIINTKVDRILAQVPDHSFENAEISYINLCLREGSLPFLLENMKSTDVEDWETTCLGIDVGGNYFMGKAKHSIKHINVIIDNNLSTPLSEIGMGVLKPFKGSRLIWEAFLDNHLKTFYINTLPIDVQNSVLLLKGTMHDSLHNKDLLKEGKSAQSLMVEVCAKELNLERHIEFETVLKNYHLSDLYKVLKTCQKLRLCSVNKPEMKITNFPAPDGGLLNALISYAKHDSTFDFKWERGLSPEYMALKATQPEAFLTEFVETMKEKFNELYTADDKATIHKALYSLVENINTEDSEEKLMSLLCTWGYAGVAGALKELEGGDDKSNFNKLRSYGPKAPYLKLFANSLFDLINIIFVVYQSCMNNPDFLPVNAIDESITLSRHGLNMQRMSTVHSIVLDTYCNDIIENWSYDENYYVVHLMLKCIILNAEARVHFKNEISKFVLFRGLPTDTSSLLDWLATLRSLYDCYLVAENKGQELDYNIRRSLQFDELSPYVCTRNILNKTGVQINLTRLFHYGAISNYLYDILKMNFKEKYKSAEIYFKIEMLNLEDIENALEVPFNSEYFFKHKLSEEFLNGDDYDEVKFELQSSEPDMDAIKDILEGCDEIYDEKKRSKVKIVSNGKLVDMVKFDLKICLAFGGNMNVKLLQKIRMLGEDVLIVTNKLPMACLSCNFVKVFKSNDKAWKNMTLLDPSKVYYLVFSRDIDDVDFWQRVLNASYQPSTLRGKLLNQNYWTYRSMTGEIQNIDVERKPGAAWQGLTRHLKFLEDEEAKRLAKMEEKTISLKTPDDFAEKLRNEGLDEEQIQKYKKATEDEIEKGGSWDDIFSVLDNLAMSNDVKELNTGASLIEKITEMVRKPKSARAHEMIMQTPRIFGGGRQRGRTIKNSLFREQKIIAEMESFCPGIVWNILAGTLYISEKTYTLVKNQVNLYKMLMPGVKKHKRGKQFMLNLCMLVLNDGKKVDNADGDHDTWQALISATQKYMMVDEDHEDDDQEWEFYNEEEGQGELRHGIVGERRN